MKTRLPIFVLCALLIPGLATGQIVFGEKKKEEAKQEETKKVDPAIETWVKSLAKHIADKNGVIRASAASALTAVGEPAVPVLKKIADAGEGGAAAEAQKIIAQIERRGRRGQGGEPGQGRRGRGGRGGEGGGRGGRGGGFGGRRGGNPEAMNEALKAKGLSEDHIKQVQKINEKQREESRELFRQMQDGELSREEMRDAFREMREETNKKVKEALGEENFKKYQEVQQAQRGGRRRGRGGDGV